MTEENLTMQEVRGKLLAERQREHSEFLESMTSDQERMKRKLEKAKAKGYPESVLRRYVHELVGAETKNRMIKLDEGTKHERAGSGQAELSGLSDNGPAKE